VKISICKAIACLSLAGSIALFAGGCAATPTKDSTGQYVDDSTITARVKAALLGDDQVKSFEIHVTTFKGTVQLSGFVDNSDQRDAAGRDARAVANVTEVDNNISVK